ncbi:MAG TPA: CHAT domain-containing protein [Bryobacteraceae bacterium]|nr:CHAT domain-containing protein [Bryobacteraceae bacterium]
MVRSVPPPRTPSLVQYAQRAAFPNPLKATLAQFARSYFDGHIAAAAGLARRGCQQASLAHLPHWEARFLQNLAGCQLALHQYQEALRNFVAARQLAEAARDPSTAGKIEINISSLYTQLGQIDAALDAAAHAGAVLSASQRPQVWIHMATLRAAQDRMPQALALFAQGIAAADRARDLSTYTIGWNDLGEEYLKRRQFPRAERAFLEAYRVRKLNHLRGLESCYRYLGLLRFEQGDLPDASLLLNRAVAFVRQPGGLVPDWEIYYARGRVRFSQHRLDPALDDLRIAVRLARTWRRGAPPDDATRIAAENSIQKVYAALIDAGNQLYFETHRPALAQETFESAEANRAASLRALLAEPAGWRRNLPPAYWETLRRLESAEVELLRTPGAPGLADHVRQLRGALIQWESQAGSNTDREAPDLLAHTRRTLRADTAFFSFYLAPANSYLWAVSRECFSLYRLPPGPDIAALVDRFSRDVRRGGADSQTAGAQLFQILFGQLDPAFRNKPRWLLALDAQLFELPLAALSAATRAGQPVYLAERHTLQLISGAAMLAAPVPAAPSPTGPFLAVADPIYNTADPRWNGPRSTSLFGLFTARAGQADATAGLPLARLVGSAHEAAASAAAWGGRPVLLEGPAASRARLLRELALRPAVLHFATHMLRSSQSTRPGLIVLSLNSAGQNEVLSPVEIATWNLHGALVSLSGCSSGSADVLPATGLMGLTRACQAAGARAVLASRWSTPDDTGALFLSFYRSLRADPSAGPAAALRQAQVDMLHSHTWRSNPRYWSAYFVTGNRQ